MIKRSEYVNGRVNHQAYYGQFVTPAVIDLVRTYIGEDKIKKSTDPHFNDIPLRHWDAMSGQIGYLVGHLLGEANGSTRGAYSLSDTVCVAKEAARMIKEALSSPSPANP